MIRRSNLTFPSAHFGTRIRNTWPILPLSRGILSREARKMRARTNIFREEERERENYARVDSPSFARETDCWIWCSSFRFTNVAAITARSRSTTREMGTRTDPSYAASCFFLLESLRAEIAFRLSVRN